MKEGQGDERQGTRLGAVEMDLPLRGRAGLNHCAGAGELYFRLGFRVLGLGNAQINISIGHDAK